MFAAEQQRAGLARKGRGGKAGQPVSLVCRQRQHAGGYLSTCTVRLPSGRRLSPSST